MNRATTIRLRFVVGLGLSERRRFIDRTSSNSPTPLPSPRKQGEGREKAMNALLQVAPDEALRIQSNLNPDKIGTEVRKS